MAYDVRFDSYDLQVDEDVSQQIYFCPWCGEKLPDSQRSRWFDELETLGLDPFYDAYPDRYRTGEWRTKDNSVMVAKSD